MCMRTSIHVPPFALTLLVMLGLSSIYANYLPSASTSAPLAPAGPETALHSAAPVVINEIVTDPQQDWSDSDGGNGIPFDAIPGTGTITPTDEWLELLNSSDDTLDLTEESGWLLAFVDTTPETLNFADPGSTVEFVFSRGGALTAFLPGEYLVVGNPPGAMNNDIFITLIDASGHAVDDVEIGDDPEGDGDGDGAPDGGPAGGNATGIDDEAIARVPNASDTDDDVLDFVQKEATIGAFNISHQCFTYDFPVAGGAWYMISLPVTPEHVAVDSLFPGAVAAFAWDFASQSYVQVTELQPERAYWLLYLDAATAEVCGQPLESYTTPYDAVGWDMIGAVNDSGAVMADPTDNVVAMFGWDAAGQNYVQIDPMVAAPPQGYWILVIDAPATVNVGGGMAAARAKASPADLAAAFENFGSLPPAPPLPLEQERSVQAPERYSLSQNYPNPFNPETVIEYGVPQAGQVSLHIYDLLGREVRALVDEKQAAGVYRVRWNGRDARRLRAESGVYFVRMQAGEFVQVRKIVLLK